MLPRGSLHTRSWTTAPRTYMSAAGLQSEVDGRTLAQLACHDAQYRHQVEGLRSDVERKVKNISQEERIVQRTLVSYKRKQRKLKRDKKLENAKLFPPIESQITFDTTPTDDTNDIGHGSELSSTKVNARSRKLSKSSDGSTDSLLAALDEKVQRATATNLLKEPHRFLIRNEVIFEEPEPSESDSDDGGDSEGGEAFVDHTTANEMALDGTTPRYEPTPRKFLSRESTMLPIFDTPRSQVSVRDLKLDVPLSSRDEAAAEIFSHSGTGRRDSLVGTPKSNTLEDVFKTPKFVEKANPHGSSVEASMSFMKLVRLGQSSALSKNLGIVDQLTKRIQQPKKLPALLAESAENRGEVAKILGSNSKVKHNRTLYRDVQSDFAMKKEKTFYLETRGVHSDTKAMRTRTSSKDLVPFKSTGRVDESRSPFKSKGRVEESRSGKHNVHVDRSHGNSTNAQDSPNLPIPVQEDSAFLKTRTWLQNSTPIENEPPPSLLQREKVFIEDGTGLRTISSSGNSHIVKYETTMTPASHMGVSDTPDGGQSVASILGGSSRRRKESAKHLNSSPTRNDSVSRSVDQSPTKQKSEHPRNTHFIVKYSGQSRKKSGMKNALEKLPLESMPIPLYLPATSNAEEDPRYEEDKPIQLNEQEQAELDELTQRLPAEARLEAIKVARRDRKEKEKPHYSKVLKDERKALAKEELLNNNVKWRVKLARVKEVHFLGSEDN